MQNQKSISENPEKITNLNSKYRKSKNSIYFLQFPKFPQKTIFFLDVPNVTIDSVFWKHDSNVFE